MKTSYLQKVTLFFVFCLFCFSAKTSTAQLVPGDLAIIGVNAEPTVTTTPGATISFVALAAIPSGTIVHLTDIGYTGSAFVLTPEPPGTTSPDGTANWTINTRVPAGTVFAVTIKSGVSPTVSILPSNYGSISLDPISWSHAVAAPIPLNAGDSWLLYTGTKTSPNFIYGFTNSKNPDLDEIDVSTGWTKDGKTPKNQSSILPSALKTANAYTSLISYKTLDQQRDFNAYSGSFYGSESSLLAMIRNPESWTTTDNTAEAEVLIPGAAGGAFPGTQPIYKLVSSVLSVTSNPATGTFGTGGTIAILVKFSDVVNVVSGTPRLKLNSGNNTYDTYATYASGTGTNTLTFNYTVAPGEASTDLNYTDINALELNGAVLTAPLGDNALLQLPAIGTPEALAGSSSVVIDGVQPTVASITSTPANKSYGSGDVISIKVIYSKPVSVSGTLELHLNMAGKSATLSAGTSTSMTFGYTVQPGDNIAKLDYADVNALVLISNAMVKDALGNPAILTLPAPGATGSLADNNISIDTTLPTVAGVRGTSGSYKIGETASISINFSEKVTVTGTPLLALNVGTPAGNATYASGSGTSTLTFNYTVAAGQSNTQLDYTSTTALSLNGGSIKDAAGNDAILTLASPGAVGSLSNGTNIVINGIPPTVLSIVRKTPTTTLTNSSSVEFAVTFSEAVTGVDINDFQISNGSVSFTSFTSVVGTGATYTITVGTGVGNGNLAIDLKSTGTGIVNSVSNPIQSGFGPSESYTIDKLPPSLSTVTIQSNHAGNGTIAKAGDLITISFSASERINTPTVTINGNTAVLTNPVANNWVATYTTQATDNDGLVPFSIAYSDLAGNTPAPRTTTTNASSVTFNKTAPTLTAVTIASNNAAYPAYAKTGAIVTLGFTASKSIQTPTVTIAGVSVPALPAGGFNWTSMYALPAGMAEGEIPFTINYSDAFGNAGTVQTTVSTGSMVTFDKTIPTLSNVSISSNNPNPALAKPGDEVTLTFTASERTRTPSVSFYGSPSMSIVPQGNNVWTATGILSPLNAEGAVPFEIQYLDFAGNAGIAITTTNDVSSVTYDKTLPDAPNFLGVQAGDKQNVMTWFLNSDYAKYELIGGTTGALGNDVLTTITAANATNPMTFTQTGLTNFQTYYYALRVTDAAGNMNTSYTTSGTPLNGQTITFDQPAPAAYGSSFTLAATSTSGLPVTFTSNEPALATISGNTVTVVGANNLQSVSIIATQAGDANYSYAEPVIRLLQIKPKPVTVTAIAQSKVYGEVDPVLAVPTISPALIGTDVSTGSLSRATGENVDDYAILQNSFNLDQYKYAITYVPANFTIGKKPITITPKLAYSKTYGATDPVFEYNFTPLLSTDVISGELARMPGEDASTYNFDLGTLTAGSNYNLILSPLPQFTINKSVITVTPITASIQYGDTEPALTYTYTPALKTGDDFTGALGRAPGDTPDTYLINQGTLALSNNYTLNFSPLPVNFVVLKKNIAITPTAGQGKVYGDVDGTINYVASPALLNGDTFSGALSRTTGSDVNNYQIAIGTLVTSNPQNYNLQLGTENYAITKKPILVTATAVSQVYGDADPVSLPYTLSTPLTNGDSFTGKLARTPGIDIGSYPINIGNLALSANYDLSFTAADLTITQKPITITPKLAYSKTYGATDPVFEYTFTPLVSSDVISGALTRMPGEDVSTYNFDLGTLTAGSNYNLMLSPLPQFTINKSMITVTPITASIQYGDTEPTLTYTYTPALKTGDDFTGALGRAAGDTPDTYLINQGTLALNNNYTLNFSALPVNFVVLKKNIAITPTAGQGKVYGDVDGTINYVASPALLNGDTFSGALSRTTGSDVNNYQIAIGTLVTSNPQNYNLQLGTENYAITKKPILVTATAVSQVYGDADPVSLPYTLSTPLTNGDSFTGKLARTPGIDIGSYPINIGNLALSANYDLSFTAADLTIGKKPIFITAVNKAKIYGDADPIFDYTAAPALISGDSFSGILGRITGENVGNYALTLGSLKVSDNYSLILNPGTEFLINKKAINVLADSKSKVYGTADPVFSYTPTPALLNNDVFSGALSRTSGEDKGTYPTIIGSLSAGSNYDLNLTAANLTISPAPLTLTADPQTKFVGTANPVFTGQYTGFVNGEGTSVLTSPAVYNTVATDASPIGTYPIVPSGAAAQNYTITFVNGVLTVKPGAPTSIALAGITLYENQTAGTKAGTLSSTSEDQNATFAYSLVSGNGDTDNGSFQISGNQLLTAASLDYETKKVYSILVRSSTQYGFSLDKIFTINLSDVNEIPTLDAIANKTICYTTAGQTIDLTGISAGPETGQKTIITVTGSNVALLQSLTVSPIGASSSNKGSISYRVKNGASGVSTITVTVKDDGGTDNGGVDTYSRTFVLTVNALPVVAISANKGDNNNANSTTVSKGETVVLTANGGSNYVWAVHSSIISGLNTGMLTVRPNETTTYTVTVSNANGCSDQKSFTITVLDDMEKIKATNILSPNGDGYNDKWIIENIDFYPNNEVKIFDRSGRMVYSKKGYDNSWDGTLNGSPLAEGTYFYAIDFGKNKRIIKGFITIIKEN